MQTNNMHSHDFRHVVDVDDVVDDNVDLSNVFACLVNFDLV